MKTRREIFGMLAAVPLLGAVLVPRKKVKVETLEHDPKTGYITRWEFNTVEEAEDFVRDLIPELTYIKILCRSFPAPHKSITSGYRDAVRAQFEADEIKETQWKIVSKKTGGMVLDAHISFGNIGMVWAWLENIRVNGQVVTRNGTSHISEYLTQPFKKGNPVIDNYTRCMGFECRKEIPYWETFCEKCYLEKEARYAEYDIKHNPEYLKHSKNFTLERILALAEYKQKALGV